VSDFAERLGIPLQNRPMLFIGVLAAITVSASAPTTARPQTRAGDKPPTGKLTALTLFDSSYRRERKIWVYTPTGYDAHAATPYPLLVAFDGEEYQEEIPLPRVLDSLAAAGRAPGFVAVLIDNSSGGERIADLGNAHRMVDFLGRQLMPYVRAHWRVTTDPHRVIITGSSAGGLASSFAALERPDLFGNVLSQSGAFWRGAEASNDSPYEWLATRVRQLPKRDVTFLLDVGALEDHTTLGGSGPNFRDATRRFHDALLARGYAVTYTEVRGGQHAPQFWTPRLAPDIVTLTSRW